MFPKFVRSECNCLGTSEITKIAFNNQSTMLLTAMVPISVHSECIIILACVIAMLTLNNDIFFCNWNILSVFHLFVSTQCILPVTDVVTHITLFLFFGRIPFEGICKLCLLYLCI